MLKCVNYCTIAVLQDSSVCAWGSNLHGQLGLGNYDDQENPVIIPFFQNIMVKKIDCGIYHVMALDMTNKVYAWGYNEYGQLGLGDLHERNQPEIISFFQDHPIRTIKCNTWSSFAIDFDDHVYAWGSNCYGNLGLGHNRDMLIPQLIEFFENVSIRKIYCSQTHIFATDVDNNVYGWGANDYEQLEIDNQQDQWTPQLLDFFQDKYVHNIICDYNMTLIITDDNIYFCGYDYYNFFGLRSKISTPQPLNWFKNKDVQKIFCSNQQIYAVDKNNKIYHWKPNRKREPNTIIFNQDIEIKKVVFNENQTYILTTNNDVYRLEDDNKPNLMEYFQENPLKTRSKYPMMKSAMSVIR